MQIEFVDAAAEAAVVAVLVHEERVLSEAAKAWDGRVGGALSRAVAAGRFTGAAGQTLALTAPSGVASPQILAVGAGARDKLDELALEAAAGHAYNAVKASGFDTLAIDLSGFRPAEAARAAYAARLASYRFDKYLTREKPERKPSIATLQVVASHPKAAEAAYAPLSAVADGVFFARDLVAEPANILYPEEFARRCQALSRLGLEVEVLDEAAMAKLGMRTLLAVGQGSTKESRLVVMRWSGGSDKSAAPLVFVGKGVCFDSGGLSLKTPEGMEDMKWDMGGGAAVAGLMCALAGRKAKANAVGVIGMVENMPDGDAQRPGDIVVSMSGQTVEVLNTDAEGRLVLADALWYAQDRFKPRFMVDLATLTGAMIVALGNDFAGLFSNDEPLAAALLKASTVSGENLWRMPLPAQYERLIETPIADMKNTAGRNGGSITAALFLQKFVNGVPWAHLDIAPVAWRKDSKVPTVPDGAAGFGVRLLDRLVADESRAEPMAAEQACEVWFYHLEQASLDHVLPELLQKTLAKGWRALVRSSEAERIEHLDGWLWNWREDGFLPHGLAEEPFAERQPVLLTTAMDNPNRAQALFLLDAAEPGALDGYTRCILVFDGRDETPVAGARRRWKEMKGEGRTVSYWKQGAQGGWEQQA